MTNLNAADCRPTQAKRGSFRAENEARRFGAVRLSVPTLEMISLGYLAIPSAIFFGGYLKPVFAVPTVAVLMLAISSYAAAHGRSRTADGGDEADMLRLQPRQLTLVLAAVVFFVFVSGIGGYGHQDPYDWDKHNAMINDLINRPWPVFYEHHGARYPLVYYIAYYLPAVAVGRMFHSRFLADQMLFAWSCLGLTLVLLWVFALVGRVHGALLALFLAFSGMDILGVFLKSNTALLAHGHIEWWAGNWQYSANETLLFYVPNQAIAGWLISAVLLRACVRPRGAGSPFFIWSFSPLVSPFVALGSLPFALIAAIGGKQYSIASPPNPARRPWLNARTAAGAVLLFLQGLYFLAMGSGISPASGAPGETLLSRSLAIHSVDQFGNLLLFELLEFGGLAMVVCLSRSLSTTRWRVVAGVAIATLTALPFVRYGKMNDLVMRASIPALFVLCILIGRTLAAPAVKRAWKGLLIVLLFAGVFTGAVDLHRHLADLSWSGMADRLGSAEPGPTLLDVNKALDRDPGDPDWFIKQYVGHGDALFFRWFAKTGGQP